jgi:hypothetical protein
MLHPGGRYASDGTAPRAKFDTMVNRLAAMVVVIAGLLFDALHYWPPK